MKDSEENIHDDTWPENVKTLPLPSCPSPIGWIKSQSVTIQMRAGVLTIYMENPEIPFGKSNGTHHSIWSTSKNNGLLVKVMHFYYSFWDLQRMFIHFACYPSSVETR